MNQGWWTAIDMPEVRVRDNDHISYVIRNLATGVETKNIDAICYARHIAQMSGHRWEVQPSIKNCEQEPMNVDDYLTWVSLAVTHNLMPEATEPWVDKDGKLRIVLQGHHHEVYAGLNAYRWAINLGRLPTLVVRLLEARPQIHFYQALYYSLKKHNWYYAHSFTDFISPAHNKPNKSSLIDALLVCYFFKESESSPCRLAPNIITTSKAIVRWAKEVGIPFKMYDLGSTITHLDNDEDILWDEWSPLFTRRNFDKQYFINAFEEVMKAKKT